MSKIEITNAYERISEEDVKFYKKLESLNIKRMNYTKLLYNRDYTSIIGFEGYSDKIIIPDSLFPVGSKQTNYTYLANQDTVLYRISYYPGMNKSDEDEFETSILARLPFSNVLTEKEYILESASIITEEKYGHKNENQLKHAIEKALEGNYSSFTNEDNSRSKLRKINPEELISYMYQILIKNEKYEELVTNSNNEEIIELFIKYIKETVEKDNKKINVLFLDDLLGGDIF